MGRFSSGSMEKEQYENIGGVILKDLGLSDRKTIGSYEVKSMIVEEGKNLSLCKHSVFKTMADSYSMDAWMCKYHLVNMHHHINFRELLFLSLPCLS